MAAHSEMIGGRGCKWYWIIFLSQDFRWPKEVGDGWIVSFRRRFSQANVEGEYDWCFLFLFFFYLREIKLNVANLLRDENKIWWKKFLWWEYDEQIMGLITELKCLIKLQKMLVKTVVQKPISRKLPNMSKGASLLNKFNNCQNFNLINIKNYKIFSFYFCC